MLPIPEVPKESELAQSCLGVGSAPLPELLKRSVFIPDVETPLGQGPTFPQQF